MPSVFRFEVVTTSVRHHEEGFAPPGHIEMVFGMTRRDDTLLATSKWVFGVTRRVLPLLPMSKIVFDVTRRFPPPSRHVVVAVEVV